MENKEKRASGQQQRLEAVRPSMPDTSVLYDLSDFFKVMGDGTRIQLLWALEQDVKVNFLSQKLTLAAADDAFDSVLKQVVKTTRKVEPDCEIIL